MSLRPYLPSAQFVLIVSSLALSGGLVWAAERYVAPPAPAQIAVASNADTDLQSTVDWQASLAAIEAQNGQALPTPPSSDEVQALLQSAKTSNVTDTVSRTLLVNLANAKSQGLGDDIPTQNELIQGALGQLGPAQAKVYTRTDLQIADDSAASKRAYGNALAAALAKHPNASMAKTLLAISQALDAGSADGFQALLPIESDYRGLLSDMAAIPVPQTLAPFHLQLLNDFSRIANDYPPMEKTMTDPLAGLSALQDYRAAADEASRVFINLAQALTKGDILWSKDEPGALWSSLLSAQ